jgi:membrane-associated phospholipid phosphatase
MASRPRTFLVGAGWCAVAFAVLLVLAYAWEGGRSLDARALHGFIDLQRDTAADSVNSIAMLGNPAQVGLMAAALAAVALARGRPRIAIAVIALLAATSVSSQLLKALLAYPRYEGLIDGGHVSPAAFPSGHATAAMSIALAAVLVAPPRARPLAALLGTAFALSVAFAIVTLGWHFPSDVVGGFLLATGWALVTAAALRAAGDRWPEHSGRTRAGAALQRAADAAATLGIAALAGLLLLALAGVSGALVLTHGGDMLDFAAGNTALVVVGAAIAVAAAALLAGVTAALRRS